MEQEVSIKVNIRFAQGYNPDVARSIIEENLIKTELDVTELEVARTNAHVTITTAVKATFSTEAIKSHIIQRLKAALLLKYSSMECLKLIEEAEIYGNV